MEDKAEEDWEIAARAADDKFREQVRRRMAGEERSPERIEFERQLEEPKNITLAGLSQLALGHLDVFGQLPCRGNREPSQDGAGGIGACFALIERDCPQRASRGCPKRVAEFERTVAEFRSPAGHGALDVAVNAGIPRAMAKMSLEGALDETESVKQVTTWWRSRPRPRALLLAGENQIGKSVAAADLATRWGGRFVHLPSEFKWFSDREWVTELKLCSLVVFDDIGAEIDGFGGETVTLVAGVFCALVDAGAHVIVTANRVDNLEARYSRRFTERLKRHGVAFGVK